MTFEPGLEFARMLDSKDELSIFRNKFYFPKGPHGKKIYLVGNSLGLQPKIAGHFIEEELKKWKDYAVEGHFQHSDKPWFYYHQLGKDVLASLLGATTEEVVAMNNLTTNLHLMLVSFYRPTAKKFKILMEGGAFPSDQYAVETQVIYHGYDPAKAVVEVFPRHGEHTLRTEDILQTIGHYADELALVLFSGVQYYTGQWFDMPKITAAAHSVNARAGFDLAHAIGNVPMSLHDWGVDFAVWCSYKYLNSGPGGVGGVFIHKKHGLNNNLPRFGGWWGHHEQKRFQMKKGFEPMPGVDGWQLSNVNVLSHAAHLAGLKIFTEAGGIENLRRKSEKQSAYLLFLLQKRDTGIKEKIKIITPLNSGERGSQLSILAPGHGRRIQQELEHQGVIADYREPDVIRVAPVPLYNSFEDIFKFYEVLKKVVENEE